LILKKPPDGLRRFFYLTEATASAELVESKCSRFGQTPAEGNLRLRLKIMEPLVGIEPTTYSLRMAGWCMWE
jgi:hypothetical protein